jgi:hypothetical protein
MIAEREVLREVASSTQGMFGKDLVVKLEEGRFVIYAAVDELLNRAILLLETSVKQQVKQWA